MNSFKAAVQFPYVYHSLYLLQFCFLKVFWKVQLIKCDVFIAALLAPPQ